MEILVGFYDIEAPVCGAVSAVFKERKGLYVDST